VPGHRGRLPVLAVGQVDAQRQLRSKPLRQMTERVLYGRKSDTFDD
jgi:hypothetical protein